MAQSLKVFNARSLFVKPMVQFAPVTAQGETILLQHLDGQLMLNQDRSEWSSYDLLADLTTTGNLGGA